jgi:hypothetical protein
MGWLGINRLVEGRISTVAVWAAILGALAGGLAAAIITDPRIGLVILLALVVPAPILVRAFQRKWDPFEPIQIFVITFMVLFVLRPIAEIVYNIEDFYQYYPLGEKGFVGACAICLVGIGSLYLGYALNLGRRIATKVKPLPQAWDTDRSIRFGIGVLVVAAIGTALFAATIGPGTLFRFYLGRTTTDEQTFLLVSGYVGLAPYLVIPATTIFLLAWLKKRTPGVFCLFLGSLLVALYLVLPRGDRTYLLALVLPLLALAYLRRGRRPTPWQLVGAVAVAMIVLNVIVQLRNVETRDQAGVGTTVVKALANPLATLKDFAVSVDLGEFSVLELEYEAITSDTNNLPLHPGATAASAVTLGIPRAIIGTKPKSGVEHTTQFLFRNQDRRASFGPSMFGDEFADWGWVTLIFWSLLVGVVARALWEYFKLYETNEGIQIVLAAILPVLVIMTRNNIPDTIGRSLQLVFPLILCLIVCARPRTRRVGGYRVPLSSSGSTPARTASR